MEPPRGSPTGFLLKAAGQCQGRLGIHRREPCGTAPESADEPAGRKTGPQRAPPRKAGRPRPQARSSRPGMRSTSAKSAPNRACPSPDNSRNMPSNPGSSTSTATIRASRRLNSWQIARPIPEAAPVTRIRRDSSDSGLANSLGRSVRSLGERISSAAASSPAVFICRISAAVRLTPYAESSIASMDSTVSESQYSNSLKNIGGRRPARLPGFAPAWSRCHPWCRCSLIALSVLG